MTVLHAEALETGLDARIEFAARGLDLGLDPDELASELRRSAEESMAEVRSRPAGRAQRQGADGARRRLLVLRRPDPAHVRLRGDARHARRPRRALRSAPPRVSAGARARRRGRADRPRAARLRPRPARGGARPGGRPRVRLPRPADALRPLPARRQDGRCPRRLEAPQLFWLRVAMGVCLGERQDREERALELYGMYAEPPVLLGDADALQRRHRPLAAVELLPLRRRRLARVDRAARHRRERDVLEVGGRPRRLVDGGPRHRLAHPRHERREPGRDPVPEAPQRPARRGQPGRQARRARAAPTSRSGTTTSATSSSCAATPATSAAAPTT